MDKFLVVLKNITARMGSAGGRNILSFVTGGVTIAIGFGVINQGQGADLTGSVQKVMDAFNAFLAASTTLLGALTTFAGVATALWASFKASPSSQAEAVTKAGGVVIMPPDIANATPNVNIKSSDDVKVVPK
jgi:hypothetical protein